MTRWYSDEVHPKSLLERLRYMHAHRLSPEQASRLTPRQREILKSDVMRVDSIARCLDYIGKINLDASATGKRPRPCPACEHVAAPTDSARRMLSDLRSALEC